MTSNIINFVCALLMVFVLAYTLYFLAPLFAYAALFIALAYGYAWLRRYITK